MTGGGARACVFFNLSAQHHGTRAAAAVTSIKSAGEKERTSITHISVEESSFSTLIYIYMERSFLTSAAQLFARSQVRCLCRFHVPQ